MEEIIVGSRPIWQKKIFVSLFPLTQLPKRSPLLNRLLHKIKNWPIIWDIVEKLPLKGDYGFVIPNDQIIRINQNLELNSSVTLPSNIVDHFIEKAKHHVIMHYCLCRFSNKCKDYPYDLGCLFLGEGALEIDPKYGRVVTKEKAKEHIKKCRAAGLIRTIGKFWIDSLAGGITQSDKLMGICNCCPCCCIDGLLRFFPPQITKNRYSKLPGLEIKITDRCTGCGACTKNVCYLDQIHLVSGRAVIGDRCRGCGRCVAACPNHAIEIKINDELFLKKTIKRLSKVLNVS